jgi:hypothetical protein
MKFIASLSLLVASPTFAMGIGDNLCSEINQHYVEMGGTSRLATLGRTTLDDIIYNWAGGYVSALTDAGIPAPMAKVNVATNVETLKAQCKSHPEMRLAEVILQELGMLAK